MLEMADIFREYGDDYRHQYPLSSTAYRVMNAIEYCRTAQLGGHADACDDCGHIQISYNSCRNRHCPKCQNIPKERWVEARKADLLPVPYFHIVFTVPHDLNERILRNKADLYDILLKASAETLQELTRDPKYLGAQIGFISVLHTWGQNLMDHPHVHCIVTGGGLSPDQTQWISAKTTFFLPVKVMSRLFRGKFLYLLNEWYAQDNRKDKQCAVDFQKMLNQLYKKEWVVYCKAPFSGPEQVIKYLGRYTHKVAISNQRLVHMEAGKVAFTYRDYKDEGKNKTMSLSAFEFIRRFLLHVLPSGFVKIRHYGILSHRNRVTHLERCKQILGVLSNKKESKKTESWKDVFQKLTGIDPTLCPVCGKGHLITRLHLHPRIPPPLLRRGTG